MATYVEDMKLITAPPGWPNNVTAVRSGPTSVSISWAAPTSGGTGSRYDIYYVAKGVPSTSGGSTTSTSYVLTNLQFGVQYNISVVAVGTYLGSRIVWTVGDKGINKLAHHPTQMYCHVYTTPPNFTPPHHMYCHVYTTPHKCTIFICE